MIFWTLLDLLDQCVMYGLYSRAAYNQEWLMVAPVPILIGDQKTCSCPLIRYFGTLFWNDITIFYDENHVNKLLIGRKQVFFSQLKIITNFHSKITAKISY